MNKAKKAYQQAQKRIAECDGETLDLSVYHDVTIFQHLQQIPPEIAQLQQLRTIKLKGSGISDLSSLADLTALEVLYCDQTKISDLSPLAHLTALQHLHCADTQISDLSPLADLTALQYLDCESTKISDLSPLAKLTALRQLDCNSTEISDLSPLAHLTALQRLHCSYTQISDLSPLADLTALQYLDCRNTQISDLSPLANLTALQRLYFGSTPISDLSPLAKLTALRHLDCNSTEISDLSPLAHLTTLQDLDCSYIQISDLSPLVKLTALQHLDCRHTQISDLSPLAHLTTLQDLDCSSTQISDLSPLVKLPNIEYISIARNKIQQCPRGIFFYDTLRQFSCDKNTSIKGLPATIFESLADYGNALEPIRDYLHAHPDALTDQAIDTDIPPEDPSPDDHPDIIQQYASQSDVEFGLKDGKIHPFSAPIEKLPPKFNPEYLAQLLQAQITHLHRLPTLLDSYKHNVNTDPLKVYIGHYRLEIQAKAKITTAENTDYAWFTLADVYDPLEIFIKDLMAEEVIDQALTKVLQTLIDKHAELADYMQPDQTNRPEKIPPADNVTEAEAEKIQSTLKNDDINAALSPDGQGLLKRMIAELQSILDDIYIGTKLYQERLGQWKNRALGALAAISSYIVKNKEQLIKDVAKQGIIETIKALFKGMSGG